MESTKMKTAVWVKKLQAQRKLTKGLHEKALVKFQKDVTAWKLAFDVWTRKNLVQKIARINTTELRSHVDKYDKDRPGFDTSEFFKGAPRPPKYPTTTTEAIRRELRRLSITQPDTVVVDESDVQKFFGPGKDEDE